MLSRCLPLLVLFLLAACGYPETVFRPQAKADQAALASDDAAPALKEPGPAPAPPEETRKPFIVIHFEEAQPDYAQDLYDALKGALARKPSARFDLVAVTRNPDAAERSMADVMHTITAMGMPAERLSLSSVAAADDKTNEVWIYVR